MTTADSRDDKQDDAALNAAIADLRAFVAVACGTTGSAHEHALVNAKQAEDRIRRMVPSHAAPVGETQPWLTLLDEFEKRASPAPWNWHAASPEWDSEIKGSSGIIFRTGRGTTSHEQEIANGRFVTALRNAWPQIKAALAPSATPSSVADEINRVWAKICKGHAEPVTEEALLVKRVKWIEAQLDAAETNFRVTNKAYVELDAKLRAAADRGVNRG